MKYAVIKTGGKQYRVFEGQVLDVEKIVDLKTSNFSFDQVLLMVEDEKVSLGKPFLTGAKVEAKVVEQFKDKKIRLAKFRAKSRYRKVQGHRQQKTKVEILKIKAVSKGKK